MQPSLLKPDATQGQTHTIFKFGFEPSAISLEPAFFEPELQKCFIYHPLKSLKVFWGDQCKNLWSSSLFDSPSYYFPWLYCVDFSVASLYSLFYVTRDFRSSGSAVNSPGLLNPRDSRFLAESPGLQIKVWNLPQIAVCHFFSRLDFPTIKCQPTDNRW